MQVQRLQECDRAGVWLGRQTNIHLILEKLDASGLPQNFGDTVSGKHYSRTYTRTDDIFSAGGKVRVTFYRYTGKALLASVERDLYHLAGNFANLHFSVGLAVAEFALLVFLGLVGEDGQLFAFTLL